jgi:hypothetical protein
MRCGTARRWEDIMDLLDRQISSPTLCIGMIDSLNENIWSWGSWIPSNIATVGNVVRLKEHRSDRKWKEGWKVVLVGKKELKSVVKLDSSDYKNHRKMSDI